MDIYSNLERAISYTISLPERTVRSLSAGIGGTSKLMTDSLIPPTLRGTAFYRYFLGNTQRFLIESLGEVDHAYDKNDGDSLPEDYAKRKVAGNIVDTAGLFAFHFSPLWFFALIGDAAKGSHTYLNEIVRELKKDGVLEQSTEIKEVNELFQALQSATSKSTMPLDTPPLSKEDLQKLQKEIAESYRTLYTQSLDLVPTPDELWHKLMSIREREAIPLVKLMGTLSLKGAAATGRVTGSLFYKNIVQSYAQSIEDINHEGFNDFFARVSAPYIKALGSAFSLSKETWTERLFKRFKKKRKSDKC